MVDSDGSKPVVVRRTDIPSAEDPRAVRLGVAANRVAQLNLDFDPAVVQAISQEIDVSSLWREDELKTLFVSDKEEFSFLGAGEESTFSPHPSEQPRFPLSIVLTTRQVRGWRDYKERIKEQDDTRAFLVLLGKAGT